MKLLNNLEEFKAAVAATSNGKILVIDFYAEWCGPCKKIAPCLEKLAEKYKDKADVYKVNVDDADDIAAHCKISAMPTFHVYKNGKEEKACELVGASEEKLKGLFDDNC
ncbi:thioredoxin [Lingula anatina]|uniref:Thioredoxin n=1 Tax=Lingula anatina TaxID=7574 RepID=A0A1S3I8V7_LINAN|nr:thioredoxin [Lingula anatina]|eukprot:XP_013394301.1 thioredoxin [Lingula anatina]